MNPITHAFLLTGLAIITPSCGFINYVTAPYIPIPESIEAPIEAPVVAQKAPAAPVSTSNPLHAFATPDGDLKLPTEAQTAEGKDSSIGTGGGTGQGGNNPAIPDSSPSISISPPAAPVTVPVSEKPGEIAAKPEDELDPQ